MSLSSEERIRQRALRRLGTDLCGRYTIRRLIGVGGMAAVYAGTHRNGHAVAIKILHERFTTDPEVERLFRREARLANAVGHPGVVPVIDDEVTPDGCAFLVMPLLEAETLRARALRLGKKLPVSEVIEVTRAVLGVLAAAHARKIVHRDIKPENVLVTSNGEIRVLDFGIGRLFDTGESASATKSGRPIGTPAFMAPEQALGRLREIDGRTDLWALGATMFTLLSGRLVHEAPSPTEIAVMAATKPARPLADVAADVPEAIRHVVDRALAFEKEARWENAETMACALRAACGSTFGETEVRLLAPIAPPARVEDDLDVAKSPPIEAEAKANSERDARASATERLVGATTRTSTGSVPDRARGGSRPAWWAAFGAALFAASVLGAVLEHARNRPAISEATVSSANAGTHLPPLPASGVWVVQVSDGAVVSLSRAKPTACQPATATAVSTATDTNDTCLSLDP